MLVKLAKENSSTTIDKLSDCIQQTKGFESIVTEGTFISVILQFQVLDLSYTSFNSVDYKQTFDYQQK